MNKKIIISFVATILINVAVTMLIIKFQNPYLYESKCVSLEERIEANNTSSTKKIIATAKAQTRQAPPGVCLVFWLRL